MAELKEVFEMVTKQTEPDLDSWKEQEDRHRRSSRNRRMGGFAVAAAIVAIAVVAAVLARTDDEQGTPPAIAPPSTETPQMLSIVDVGSGTVTEFAAPRGSSQYDVSLDGTMVTYTDLDENGATQVFVMDADGSNARQLTHEEGAVRPRGLSWSPDSSMIAYERDTSDNPQVFVVGVADGISTQVTTEPQGAVDPGGWTPDGGSIVYSTINSEGSHYTARSLDLSTGRSRLLVADASTPTLSPDGASIAFTSWLKPQGRLIIANNDGSERRTIDRSMTDDGYQRWSPDSTQIAYIGSTDEDGNGTYVYDLATGETRFVTDGTVESWIDNDHILVS